MKHLYFRRELEKLGYVKHDDEYMTKLEHGSTKYFKKIGKHTYKFSHTEGEGATELSDVVEE